MQAVQSKLGWRFVRGQKMRPRFFGSVVVMCTALVATVAPEEVLYQYCTGRSDCGAFGYVCGQNRTCQCDSWYVPNKSREKCVGGVGQRCKYDEHCIEGAFCEHQTNCSCKENLYAYENGLVCSSSGQFLKPAFVLNAAMLGLYLFDILIVLAHLCSMIYYINR